MTPASIPRRFSVTEQYLVLDVRTGAPVRHHDPTHAPAFAARGGPGERAHAEGGPGQGPGRYEVGTPLCPGSDQLEARLLDARMVFERAARMRGHLLAGTGLPPYVDLAREPDGEPDDTGEVPPLGFEHRYASGVQVRVEVPSASEGKDALTRMARWLPTLLAVTANSPIWAGEETGYASWRHVIGVSWPSGRPRPAVALERGRHAAGAGQEGAPEQASPVLKLAPHLPERHPTVELNIADAQLDAADAAAFATVVRALIDRALRDGRAGIEAPQLGPGIVSGAGWLAARHGMERKVLDPVAAEWVPPLQMLERLLHSVEGEFDRFGDRSRIDDYLRRLRREGGPAQRQLAAFREGGMAGLMALYGAADEGSAAA